MVLGRIVGRFLSRTAAADSTAVTRVVTTAATDSAVAAKAANEARKAIAAARKAANPFDYGRKVFALPEGPVTTRSGRVYTRTMGSNGERIYTDATGNRTYFNQLYGNCRNEYGGRLIKSHSRICRVNPNGGQYSIDVESTRCSNQKLTKIVSDKHPCGLMRTQSFEITPQGRVVEMRMENSGFIGDQFSLSGTETRFGCPRNAEATFYDWLNHRWTTEAPPQWTSIADFSRGL